VIKTLGTQLTLLLRERETRQDLVPFLKFLVFLLLVMLAFSGVFQVLMRTVERQDHSLISGFYWVLVTMSTLGFGDIVFQTDLGRTFSVFVLFSGVVLLLIVLPYIFLNYVAIPWLQASLRLQAPREVKDTLTDHVVLTGDDTLVQGTMKKLDSLGIPYLLVEPNPDRAGRLASEGISVITGEVDSKDTYQRAHVERARMVLANLDDVTNTNVILTVRDVSDTVSIMAIASSDDAVDVMELAGATHVAPLRRQLGEQLAGRLNAGHAETHEIGRVHGLIVAEFPVHNTPLAGKTVRETRLRELLGLSMVGIWENAELQPVTPDYRLSDQCVPVVVGTEAQMQELNELLYIYDTNWNPVLVMGGGKVGRAATRALRRRGIQVHLVEKNEALARRLEPLADKVFIGDAANRELLEDAGLQDAPAVLLTTNDDATNVYLTVYCRRLNPELRIVSRVTRARNIASMQRAGADLVLSYDSLGVETISSVAQGRPLVLLGEGVELLEMTVPTSLEGKTLGASEIGARTGLNVVALEVDGEVVQAPGAQDVLSAGTRLVLVGSRKAAEAFREAFGEVPDEG
jgi:voltage-gated potassium channel